MKTKLLPLAILFIATTFTTKASTLGFPIISPLTFTIVDVTSISLSFTVNANGGTKTNTWIQYNTVNGWAAPLATIKLQGGSATQGRAFEGLTPSTTYYFRAYSTNGEGQQTTSQVVQATTKAATVVVSIPTISSITSNVTDISATISYAINANNGATSSIIKYGLESGTLSNQVTGFSATGNNVTSLSATIPSLLTNTTYFYQIVATNSAGSSPSAIASFTTKAAFVPQSIAEYTFENTYNNINGTDPFSINNGVSFTKDRNLKDNSAINIINTGSTATIAELPYGASARTVSLWVKLNDLKAPFNMLYSYGKEGEGQINGASFSAADVWHFGYNNNHKEISTNFVNTWYHFVFTYDGTNSKIYRNGLLVGTLARTWNTVNNNNLFKLGVGVGGELTFDGAIDDLKIFNYALNQTDITSLYTTNALTSIEDNIETKTLNIYPNPVKYVLHVSGKAEIFNIMGTKIVEGENEINVENLPSGIYVVKANGKSQKIVKE